MANARFVLQALLLQSQSNPPILQGASFDKRQTSKARTFAKLVWFPAQESAAAENCSGVGQPTIITLFLQS